MTGRTSPFPPLPPCAVPQSLPAALQPLGIPAFLRTTPRFFQQKSCLWLWGFRGFPRALVLVSPCTGLVCVSFPSVPGMGCVARGRGMGLEPELLFLSLPRTHSPAPTEKATKTGQGEFLRFHFCKKQLLNALDFN